MHNYAMFTRPVGPENEKKSQPATRQGHLSDRFPSDSKLLDHAKQNRKTQLLSLMCHDVSWWVCHDVSCRVMMCHVFEVSRNEACLANVSKKNGKREAYKFYSDSS